MSAVYQSTLHIGKQYLDAKAQRIVARLPGRINVVAASGSIAPFEHATIAIERGAGIVVQDQNLARVPAVVVLLLQQGLHVGRNLGQNGTMVV
jgi:hypothetical protein